MMWNKALGSLSNGKDVKQGSGTNWCRMGVRDREDVWEFRSRIRREKSERRENLEERESKRRWQHNKLIIQIIKIYITNSWGTIYRPQPKP